MKKTKTKTKKVLFKKINCIVELQIHLEKIYYLLYTCYISPANRTVLFVLIYPTGDTGHAVNMFFTPLVIRDSTIFHVLSKAYRAQ